MTKRKAASPEATSEIRIDGHPEQANVLTRYQVARITEKKWDVVDTHRHDDVVSTHTTKKAATAQAVQNLKIAKAEARKAEKVEQAKENVDAMPEADLDLIAAMDTVARLNLAKVERQNVNAWQTAGSQGERPGTPIIDWMTANPRIGRKTKHAKATSTSTTRRYSPEQQTDLVERIKTARATGISFPKLATQLNDEGYGQGGWTGPKLYALAQRTGVADLPLVKGA